MSDLISRQDAIDCCSCLHPEDCWDNLRELPSAVCEDCIWHICNYNKVDWNADRPKRQIGGDEVEIDEVSYEVGYTDGQMARPKGEWINRSLNIVYPEWERYTCSVCGKHANRYDFCPNCGADMRGEEHEID